MGSKNSCCSHSSPQPSHRVEDTLHERQVSTGKVSTNNLQHISERETDNRDADDIDADPSQDPTAMTILMQRSNMTMENDTIQKKSTHFRFVVQV